MSLLRRHTSLLIVGLLALAALLPSCSAAPVESRPDAVAAVIVSPESMTLQLGRRETFKATVLDLNGGPTNGARVFWAVEDTTVARINALGEVEARAVGTTKVAASAEGRSDVAELTVIPRQVATVVVAPSTGQVAVGGTLALQATARDAWGDAIPGRTFTWGSSNSVRATVSSHGVVSGHTPGAVTISATTGGVSGSSAITVVLAPVASVAVEPANANMIRTQQLQLRAVLRDAQGNELTGRTVTWTSSNPRTATVNGNGVVTALRRGTVTITAQSEGVSGTARIQVIL